MTDQLAPRPWNTYEHRCDYCEAESFYRMSKLVVEDEAVLELFFCGHHGNHFAETFVRKDWFVEDYTHQIQTECVSGAPMM